MSDPRATDAQWPQELLEKPAIRLTGTVGNAMLDSFCEQLDQALQRDAPLLVLELTTPGGDPDVAGRMAEDIRIVRERRRPMAFFGKGSVYSAGVVIMSAFEPSQRYLSCGTHLLVHERRLQRTIALDGPLRRADAILLGLLAEIDDSRRQEEADFDALVRGTRLDAAQLQRRLAQENWYLDAHEALALGLVRALV